MWVDSQGTGMNARGCVLAALVVLAVLGPPGVGTAAAADTADCEFPLTRTDATGTDVTVTDSPETVVTLNPSAAQTMYEIDAWDAVVGVSTFADYLPGTDEKTTVGDGNSDATKERTIALDPDIVLAPNTIDNSTVSDLRNAGLTVYRFEPAQNLDDIVEKTRLTGDLVGACERADSRADEMERQLGVVEGAVDDVERPDVFYTFFGFTAGEDTFIHEVIETAGGNNIAAEPTGANAGGLTSGYFAVSPEVVVETDPAWVVLNSNEYDRATVPAGPGGVYEDTTAYREDNAVVLDANEISQPAPRVVDAILDLVRVLHPEAYETEIRGRIDREALDGERGTTVERLADGSVRLRASSVGRADEVGFTVPAREGAVVSVREANVTLATVNPTFELRLRYDGNRTAPNGTRALESMRLSGNGIFAGDVDHLTLRMAVNRSRLGDADPETVTLYRPGESEGGSENGSDWVPLRTTRVNGTATNTTAANATDDTIVYEARTTGFRTLVLAVDEPDATAVTNRTATPAATPTTTPTATPDDGTSTARNPAGTRTDPPTTPGSAPGFGALIAVLSILLAAGGRR
jgi:putative ABC transporter PGF-CTERM-modified substrate-binding protein